MSNRGEAPALGLARSAAIILSPGLAYGAALHLALPALAAAGVPRWASDAAFYLLICTVAYLIAGILLKKEKLAPGRAALFGRLRLGRMDRAAWLWTAALFVFFAASFVAINGAAKGLFPKPAYLAPAPLSYLDLRLPGLWWFPAYSIASVLYGVLAEEVILRGVLLPRQEACFGGWAFLANGLLWAAFHAPNDPALALGLLPGAVALAWVSQRTRSTWPALVVHAAFNLVGASERIAAVFG